MIREDATGRVLATLPQWLALLLAALVGAGVGAVLILALKVAGVWPW